MSERQYLAFDIEIAKEIPEGESDWKKHRPLGISCAATGYSLGHGASIKYWYDGDWGAREYYYRPQMRRDAAGRLVLTLQQTERTILTWNGLGFDFDILAEEAGLWNRCRDLALDHIDMMFQIFCLRGRALSLDKAAKGMGLAGKPAGMHGGLAPQLWAAGEYQRVLDYVAQDVKTTLELARAVEEAGYLEWISSSGNRIRQPIDRWLTVRECLELPEPDTSWMRFEPWARSKFTGWLNLSQKGRHDGANELT